MQTKTLQEKIAELEHWLEHFINSPERTLIEADLRNLRNELENQP